MMTMVQSWKSFAAAAREAASTQQTGKRRSLSRLLGVAPRPARGDGISVLSDRFAYPSSSSSRRAPSRVDDIRRHLSLLLVRGGARGKDKLPLPSSPLLNGQRVSSFTTTSDNAGNKNNNNDNNNNNDEADELPRVLHRYPVTGCAAIGWRPYMEDEALIQADMVGVFDGHGGASVSRYVRQNLYGHIQTILPRVIKERLEEKSTTASSGTNDDDEKEESPKPTLQDYEVTLRQALEKINNDVLRIVHWSYQGSTAVVVWLHEALDKEGGRVRTLVAANIGDSRLVLSRNGSAMALSRDHKPNDPIEMDYIHSQGGKVTYPSGVPRVNGVMALSRAIGDRSETPCIRAEPDLIRQELSWNDDFYVLATDGLWDVMTNQEVVTFLHDCFETDLSDDSRQELTKNLVLEALSRGAEDNITVLVVWLR